jgi:hypothetical protein
MVRIRYVQSVPGEMISVRTYIGTEGEFRVYLYPELKKFQIIALPNNLVVSEGVHSNEAGAKRGAKAALASLGVMFAEEYRARAEEETLPAEAS